MANCLVLGGDGFIGSYLAEALAEKGHKVRAFDRFKEGMANNLKVDNPKIEIRPGNFLNRADLDEALDGMDYVFHMVSTTNPASSANDPMLDIDTNLRVSVELFQLCVEHKVKRLIFPSSGGAVYGQDLSRPIKETDQTEPVSPYGIGKLAIEGYLRYFKHLHGLDYLALRVSNPYGVRQNIAGSQGVIPIFLNLIQHGQPLKVFGDGSMVRDYIYITDLVDMLVEIFDKPAKHQTYNLGAGSGQTIRELISVMKEVTGLKVEVENAPSRPTDVQQVVLDTSRYLEEFGKPKLIGIKEGIQRTWKYVEERGKES
jgi:UDP-glucose 4-epimerase